MTSSERWAEAIGRRLTDPARLPAPARLWQELVGALRERIGTRRVNAWARGARLVSLSDEEAVVAFLDLPARDASLEELHPQVQGLVRDLTNRKTRVRFVVDPQALPRAPLPPSEEARRDGTRRHHRNAPPPPSAGSEDPAGKVTREFVEGDGRGPRTLFVCGPAGSGKSRLLERCREALLAAGREVVSMGGDHFTSLSSSALRAGRLPALHARLRATEALLLDDAHRWARRAAGREDLLRLLHQRWLAVASQCPLEDLPHLRRALDARGGMVAEVSLSPSFAPCADAPTVEDVIEAVARAYGLPAVEVAGTSRRVTEAGRVCLSLARLLTGLTADEVGRQLGGRTRAIVSRAHAEVEKRAAGDPAFRRRVSAIEESLRGVSTLSRVE